MKTKKTKKIALVIVYAILATGIWFARNLPGKWVNARDNAMRKKIAQSSPQMQAMFVCMGYRGYNNSNPHYLARQVAKYPNNELFIMSLAHSLSNDEQIDHRYSLQLADKLILLNPNNAHYHYFKASLLASLPYPNWPASLAEIETGNKCPLLQMSWAKYSPQIANIIQSKYWYNGTVLDGNNAENTFYQYLLGDLSMRIKKLFIAGHTQQAQKLVTMATILGDKALKLSSVDIKATFLRAELTTIMNIDLQYGNLSPAEKQNIYYKIASYYALGKIYRKASKIISPEGLMYNAYLYMVSYYMVLVFVFGGVLIAVLGFVCKKAPSHKNNLLTNSDSATITADSNGNAIDNNRATVGVAGTNKPSVMQHLKTFITIISYFAILVVLSYHPDKHILLVFPDNPNIINSLYPWLIFIPVIFWIIALLCKTKIYRKRHLLRYSLLAFFLLWVAGVISSCLMVDTTGTHHVSQISFASKFAVMLLVFWLIAVFIIKIGPYLFARFPLWTVEWLFTAAFVMGLACMCIANKWETAFYVVVFMSVVVMVLVNSSRADGYLILWRELYNIIRRRYQARDTLYRARRILSPYLIVIWLLPLASVIVVVHMADNITHGIALVNPAKLPVANKQTYLTWVDNIYYYWSPADIKLSDMKRRLATEDKANLQPDEPLRDNFLRQLPLFPPEIRQLIISKMPSPDKLDVLTARAKAHDMSVKPKLQKMYDNLLPYLKEDDYIRHRHTSGFERSLHIRSARHFIDDIFQISAALNVLSTAQQSRQRTIKLIDMVNWQKLYKHQLFSRYDIYTTLTSVAPAYSCAVLTYYLQKTNYHDLYSAHNIDSLQQILKQHCDAKLAKTIALHLISKPAKVTPGPLMKKLMGQYNRYNNSSNGNMQYSHDMDYTANMLLTLAPHFDSSDIPVLRQLLSRKKIRPLTVYILNKLKYHWSRQQLEQFARLTQNDTDNPAPDSLTGSASDGPGSSLNNSSNRTYPDNNINTDWRTILNILPALDNTQRQQLLHHPDSVIHFFLTKFCKNIL